MHLNRLALAFALVAALVLPSAVLAARTAPPEPFGLVLGKATLQEAEAKWTADDAVIINRGYAGVGAGSGVDGWAKRAAERIYLVDVAAVDFEGTRPVRFAFFDGTLFSVHTVLKPLLNKGTSAQNLSEEEVLALKDGLRQRYGPPTRELRDITAGKKPNVFVWSFGANSLTLTVGTLYGSTLSYSNAALVKAADAYKRKAARQ